MQYIKPKPGQIDYQRYRTYLQSIREKLPEHVFLFAANPQHFDLSSHSSLHDSWLEQLTVRENAKAVRNEIRNLEIDILLVGPFHDRQIHLHYADVKQYSCSMPPNDRCATHGDLFTHEIRLSEAGLIVHELEFVQGAVLIIECADIIHSEKIIAVAKN